MFYVSFGFKDIMKELLQFQMMQMLNPAAGGGVMGGAKDMTNTLYLMFIQMISFFIMSIFDQISQSAPTFLKEIKNRYVDIRIENTLNHIKTETLSEVSVKLDTKHEQSTVIVIRKWENSGSDSTSSSQKHNNDIHDESKEIADSLLDYIANADNVPTLQLIQSSQFIINYKDKPVEITKGIYIKIDDFRMSPETLKMQHIVFRLTSNVFSARYIREFLQQIRSQWIAEQQNKLGDTLWYFEQKIRASRSAGFDTQDGFASERARLERVLNAPPVITYEMRPFYSNKTFDNLFGEQARVIRNRIDFFISNPDWYEQKGLPYQLGILLSGKPGTGKTAILRAVANKTKRHIINLKLSNLATATQLKNIFYNDYLTVSMDESGHDVKKLWIPADKRIYVFEEIDTIGALVQERSLQLDVNKTVLQDELTLGDILQILDGTIEIPGRIIIMTSNYPERLDRALMRPGRIDVKIDFGFSCRETISEIIKGILDLYIPSKCLPDNKLTAAEVLNIVFTFNHYEGNDIVQKLVAKLNGRVEELNKEHEKLDNMRKQVLNEEKAKLSKTGREQAKLVRKQRKDNKKVKSRSTKMQHTTIRQLQVSGDEDDDSKDEDDTNPEVYEYEDDTDPEDHEGDDDTVPAQSVLPATAKSVPAKLIPAKSVLLRSPDNILGLKPYDPNPGFESEKSIPDVPEFWNVCTGIPPRN